MTIAEAPTVESPLAGLTDEQIEQLGGASSPRSTTRSSPTSATATRATSAR